MTVVLDASGLLVLLNSEPGAAAVAEELPQVIMSAVNLSEVVSKLAENGMPEAIVKEVLDGLDLEIIAFDIGQSYRAGFLRPTTRAQGLSLGDQACIGLAQGLGLPVLTADQVWATVDLAVEVRLVR